MGVFYVGYNPYTRVNGMLKIGVSNYDTPARRFGSLRQSEHFKPLGWMKIDSQTVADLFLVESYVRAKLARKYQQFGNDHFAYRISGDKNAMAQALAAEVLSLAATACANNDLWYKIGEKKYK